MRREKGISESNNFLTKEPSSVEFDSVLPRKYSSTVKGVLQYFHGSTGTRENCSVLITECLAWSTLSLYILLQCEDKFQSSLRHVLGEDGSAMEQHGVLHDGQSQTCTS